MNKILLTTGGTGGHIFPMLSLSTELKKVNNNNIKIITDQRAIKYINSDDIIIIKSDSPFRKKGLFHFILTILKIFISTIRSLIFIISFRPKIIVGSGGYVSVPVLLASVILRKKFLLYETNSVLGRVNRIFLPFCDKLLSGYKTIYNFPEKYKKKFNYIGQLVRAEFLNISHNNSIEKIPEEKKLKILVLGGSQGAKVFGERLPSCFKVLREQKINIGISQQIHKDQLESLNDYYKKNFDMSVDLFVFKKNIYQYINEADLIICRSGSSTLSELSILKKPFIAIPLPTALDNHQFFNADYFKKMGCCWIVDEKNDNFNDEIIKIIKEIYCSSDLYKNIKGNYDKLKIVNGTENFIKELI